MVIIIIISFLVKLTLVARLLQEFLWTSVRHEVDMDSVCGTGCVVAPDFVPAGNRLVRIWY